MLYAQSGNWWCSQYMGLPPTKKPDLCSWIINPPLNHLLVYFEVVTFNLPFHAPAAFSCLFCSVKLQSRTITCIEYGHPGLLVLPILKRYLLKFLWSDKRCVRCYLTEFLFVPFVQVPHQPGSPSTLLSLYLSCSFSASVLFR